ncbi:MAG: glutathione binding-like protein [Proteobacteria bacterium]|nr:glutathione binding-like protein [Pseudomonadota bacterium]
MIKLFSSPTPNGRKVHIMLEEVGLPYEAQLIRIGQGDQFKSSFLKISPNNKIPAIVDSDGPGRKPIAMFETGAILIYLAEKTGKFLPKRPRERMAVIQWLMFQMGGVGPMLGQAHHFRHYAPRKFQYAHDRYTNEAGRLYGVLDRQLKSSKFIAGERYSIADIATYPWIEMHERQGQDLKDFSSVARWLEMIRKRPAVMRGMAVLSSGPEKEMGASAKEVLFGKTQFKRR